MLVLALAVSAPARADAPALATDPALAPLLARLATHAENFEQMKRRGSYTFTGKMEELDGKGHVDATKEVVVRVTASPAERRAEILRYVEDGADKTAEAKKKADKSKSEKAKGEKRKDWHLPFLASEQPRYAFSVVEREPGRARIAFVPKTPAEDAFKGSAWVDEAAAEVVTVGFSPSKNPTFVDHVDVTMRFDTSTSLGRAPSSFTFDARGGFLVIHKHYRGSGTITDPSLAF